MRFLERPDLADRIIHDLGVELQQEEWQRKVPHLTELVYCLTKSWLNRADPSPPTPNEVLLYVCGLGLEKVVLTTHRTHVVGGECEGIFYDVDFLDYDNLIGEFKSTRMSTKRDPQEFSEGWKRQILGYMYADFANKQETPLPPGMFLSTLAVLHLMGGYAPPFPELRTWTVEADWDEVVENWQFLKDRRVIFMEHLEKGVIPRQFTYNMEWECQYCRYKFFCDAMQAAEDLRKGAGQ